MKSDEIAKCIPDEVVEAATELDLRAYNTLADVIRDLMEKNNED